MRVVSLASGSKGNAYCVEAQGRVLLIDCGLHCRELEARMRAAGLDPARRKRRDLSWLAGSWTAAEAHAFDAAVAGCRKVDPEEWK